MSFNPQISSHGYGSARIMFIGGYPLNSDIETGLALSGSAEKTLRDLCRGSKIDFNQCYLANAIREPLEYLGFKKNNLKAALSKIDLAANYDALLEDLIVVKPNVIVPLDDLALAAVFPYITTINKPKNRAFWTECYRGSILPLRPDWQTKVGFGSVIKVIPTIGPYLLKLLTNARVYARLDWEKIAKYEHATQEVLDFGSCWVAKTAASFSYFVQRQLAKNPKRLTFDIETSGGLISCISFCFDSNESCTVPLGDPGIPKAELIYLWYEVAKLLANPIAKNNQNIKYDWTINERHGLQTSNVVYDTMLMGSLLYPELPKGLDFYTSIYTPIAYYKDEGREFDARVHSRDRLYLYCAKDSLAASICADEMEKELDEIGLKDFYLIELSPSILIYKDLDERRIKIDETTKENLNAKYDRLIESNEEILRTLVNDDKFNARSSVQVGKVIYEDLKYPIKRKMDKETGRFSYCTDKDVLDELLVRDDDRAKAGFAILNRIIMCRKLYKVKEYINTPLHPDGSFGGSSNLAGTVTGRSSFSKTIDERYRYSYEYGKGKTSPTIRVGRSLQTISKHGFAVDQEIFEDFGSKTIAEDLRSMFVPRRGFTFVEGDGNSAEARIVFVLAEDYEGLADCDRKPKKHAKTAATIFNIDVNTITKDFPTVPILGIPYYDLGKRARHAGNYDQTGHGLAVKTHLPVHEANRIMNAFHASEPGIRDTFHSGIQEQLKKYHKLVTPFGRQNTFFQPISDSLYKEAYAYIPQSTISDLTKFSMWRIKEELPGYQEDYFFLAEMHDGILAEVRTEYVEEYIKVFRRVYERKFNFSLCSLYRDFEISIPCEISTSSENWQNLKEIH